MQQQVLENDKKAIRFNINITENLVNFLIHDGYLEEDDFNFEEYLDESDVFESYALGQPVSDAVIDWYDDLIDIKESEELDKEKDDRDIDFLEASKLEQYQYIVDEDNLLGCVSVHNVTGHKKPYGWC